MSFEVEGMKVQRVWRSQIPIEINDQNLPKPHLDHFRCILVHRRIELRIDPFHRIPQEPGVSVPHRIVNGVFTLLLTNTFTWSQIHKYDRRLNFIRMVLDSEFLFCMPRLFDLRDTKCQFASSSLQSTLPHELCDS